MNNQPEKQGDVFWDLPPGITYTPDTEFGCTLYVANPTEEDREYALMTRLSRNATIISEEAVRVFGVAWFKVEAGDWTRLRGSFMFDETGVVLTVLLCERETGEVVDSVSTVLAAPTVQLTPAWPGWPSGGAVPASDWNSLMSIIGMMAMAAMLVMVLRRPAEAEVEVAPGERKMLPPGRVE